MTKAHMAVARQPDRTPDQSPLARARIQRQLTVEAAAQRAGLSAEQVEWLEDGRVYRFPSTDDALAATLLYATALEIDQREARALAGLPLTPLVGGSSRSRLVGIAALLAALAALSGVFWLQNGNDSRPRATRAAALPPTWKISVDVLNGSGDITWTRQMASRIGALAYHVQHVGRADKFNYRRTAVYYEPGGDAVAIRLARQLGVATKPLPGGADPHLLGGGLADVPTQVHLEAVALAAVGAELEVGLRLEHLCVRQLAVEVGLENFLALRARINCHCLLPRLPLPARVSGYVALGAVAT
jgi:transcriptional regulator with XRE-family HTH domain